jgi:hypothetical protein
MVGAEGAGGAGREGQREREGEAVRGSTREGGKKKRRRNRQGVNAVLQSVLLRGAAADIPLQIDPKSYTRTPLR